MLFTYDRDIICLPKSYGGSSTIKIPKTRTELTKNGKIRLTSNMTEQMIFDEIRSVFHEPMSSSTTFAFSILQPMGGSTTFAFSILQPMGGTSKSLAIPSLSDSFKWTASAIVPKNSKGPPLYSC